MALFSCNHAWGFPRRRAEFDGYRHVDVQTCAKCGAQRISRVQFGPALGSTPKQQLEGVQA